jgi:hypothetical protein
MEELREKAKQSIRLKKEIDAEISPSASKDIGNGYSSRISEKKEDTLVEAKQEVRRKSPERTQFAGAETALPGTGLPAITVTETIKRSLDVEVEVDTEVEVGTKDVENGLTLAQTLLVKRNVVDAIKSTEDVLPPLLGQEVGITVKSTVAGEDVIVQILRDLVIPREAGREWINPIIPTSPN